METHWKRKFLLIWIGQFVSLISTSAVNFAIIIWLSIETKSAEVLAMTAIAALLPQALIGPLAGVYIDRWDRKKTMIFADLFVAVCTAMMIFYLSYGSQSLGLIYLMLALRSVGSAFHMPAMQAAVPLLAPPEQLLRIGGINQMIQSIAGIAGPALGAVAIGIFSIANVLWLDIIGALFAVGTLLFVHIPNPEIIKSKAGFNQVWIDLKSGAKEVLHNKGLSWMFLFGIIATFCIMPIAVLFPLLTIQYFGGGKLEISVIEIAWGVGMLLGGAILGIWKPGIRKIILINSMHIALGLAFGISGLLPTQQFITFVILTGLAGIAAAVFNATFTTVIQEEVRPEMLGRVFSMYFSIAMFPSLMGLLSTGLVADHIGINLTFIILGTVISIVGIASFFVPSLMQISQEKKSERS